MRGITSCLFVFTICLITSVSTYADLVWLKGSGKPISGLILESDDPGIVKVIVVDESGATEAKKFPRSNVKLATTTIDQVRLEAMNLSNPNSWLDFAEELVTKRSDIAANVTARRMILICLHHGAKSNVSEQVLERASRNLLHLASSSEEQRQFQKIAQIYGGLESSDVAASNSETLRRDTKDQAVLKVVQSIRKNEWDLVRQNLNSESFRMNAPKWMNKTTMIQIENAVQSTSFDSILKEKLLRIEFAMLTGTGGSTDSIDFMQNNSGSLKFDVIEEVVDFDLGAVKFRNGKWYRTLPGDDKKIPQR